MQAVPPRSIGLSKSASASIYAFLKEFRAALVGNVISGLLVPPGAKGLLWHNCHLNLTVWYRAGSHHSLNV